MKRMLVFLMLAALLAGACASDGTNNAATFGDEDTTQLCEKTPPSVVVPGVSVLGVRLVQEIKDIEVCVDIGLKSQVTPEIIPQSQCGDPCFTIEVSDLDIATGTKVSVAFKKDGIQQDPIIYDTGEHGVGRDLPIDRCVVGVGTPDPCIERITSSTLSAASGKAKIKLSWTAARKNRGAPLAGYEIWRSDTGAEGTFGLVGSVDTATLAFTDAPLTSGQSAYYYVIAFDGDGHYGPQSNVATAAAR